MKSLLRAGLLLAPLTALLLVPPADGQRFRPPPPPPPIIRPPFRPPIHIPEFRPPAPLPQFRPPNFQLPQFRPQVHDAAHMLRMQQSQVRTDFQRFLQKSPTQALSTLQSRGTVLSAAERQTLAVRAAQELTLAVRQARDVAVVSALLQKVAALEKPSTPRAELPPTVRQSVTQSRRDLEQRFLDLTLRDAGKLIAGGKWAEAGSLAVERGKFLGAGVEGGGTLTKVAAVGKRLQFVQKVEAALAAPAKGGPGAWRQADPKTWTALHGDPLPDSVRLALDGLRSLAEVRAFGEGMVKGLSEAVAVKGALGRLREARPESAGLIDGLQQDLAFKAFLEGRPGEAQQLLPEGGAPERFAAQLRDLKKLFIGEGNVETWPADRAAAVEMPGLPPEARGPPEVVVLMVPKAEGQAQGGRSTARAAALEDLPPWETPAHLEEPLRRAVEGQWLPSALFTSRKQAEQVRVEVGIQAARFQQLVTHQAVKPVDPVVAKNDPAAQDDDAKLIAAVEARLGRPLAADERQQARALRRLGADVNRICTALTEAARKRQPGPVQP